LRAKPLRKQCDDVVLVNTASLLGTEDRLQLFDPAQRVNAQIKFAIDGKRPWALAAGEPLQLPEMKAGLPMAHLTDIVRQSGEYLKGTPAQPGLDATNWWAELAIRYGVILGKVWGGSRTCAGARVQSVLIAVWRTC